MPYDFFKEIKYRCNYCMDVIVSKSDTEWTECSCGQLKIMGTKSFVKLDGDNYEDLSKYNYDNLPIPKGEN